jgi:hypothetical protein
MRKIRPRHKARKVTWGRHSRPLFAKYRGQALVSPWPPRSLRMACKRSPCAFTETAVKRALRAVRAAGETPGRLVVTKDGFAIELGDSGTARPGCDAIATPRAAANLWDELLGVQQP